jgi:hypothetical protein
LPWTIGFPFAILLLTKGSASTRDFLPCRSFGEGRSPLRSRPCRAYTTKLHAENAMRVSGEFYC